jgi:eukaryotic-like serine/threonine-protein kinase
MSLSIGTRLGPYEILSVLGRGGMGQVYRARHVKLGRVVAIKVLPEEVAAQRERLARFEQEARLASSLNHPNIITIHDVAEHDGTIYIAMELVEGRTLRQLYSDGPLATERALEVAIQLTEGLSKAHSAGIVHRDLKPENVMVTADGLVKILDFGLAKALEPAAPVDAEDPTMAYLTMEGLLVGTPRYMSPEQIGQGTVDHRSDQFSFGILLFEMLAAKLPFDGPSLASLITAISHDSAPPLEPIRRDIPKALARLVRRCLAKNPDDRYPSTADVCDELRSIRNSRVHRPGLLAILTGPRLAAAAVMLLMVSALLGWMWIRGADRRWAERDALPQITSLIETGDVFEAYRLARRAKGLTLQERELETLLGRITLPLRIVTEPAGAEVSIRGYGSPDAPWEILGKTPLEARIPYALMWWKISKEGYETFEGAPIGGAIFGRFARGFALEPAGTRPPGTVRVPASAFGGGPHRLELPGNAAAIPIGAYWIDRYEVTNREFKKFIDAGGYRDPKYWIDSRSGSEADAGWKERMESFRDQTGRPAPSTWSLGTYPDGDGDLPVGGVGWHEAAAYCRFAGKALPTIYHWFSAVGQEQLSDILRWSNFSGAGPAAVGTHHGLGGYGTYDMAGNVKEWCWNATGDGKRYVLGGAWNDPAYMFRHLHARPPSERLATHGIRCAVYDGPPDAALLDPIDPIIEVKIPPPLSDEVFEAYRGVYAYDRTALNAAIESRDDSSPHWRKEIVSFDAAYGKERMQALVFLPRNAKPPYQAVLWFPGDDVFIFRSSETLASSYLFDFIPRSGRALVYPIYQGMYERFAPFELSPAEWRDLMIQWSKDLGRTIDYLETRSDIDAKRLGYYGFSAGAIYGPVFDAVDPRIDASILLSGGLVPYALRPEMDLALFAPRSRVPTLMINGVDDFILPYDTSQKPLFDLLGAPPEQKRLARLAGGHIPTNRLEIIRETLDWLDQHLGPVRDGETATR